MKQRHQPKHTLTHKHNNKKELCDLSLFLFKGACFDKMYLLGLWIEGTEEWMSSDSLSFTSKHTLLSEQRSSDRRTVHRNFPRFDVQTVPEMCHWHFLLSALVNSM